jgi:hypothetical protein
MSTPVPVVRFTFTDLGSGVDGMSSVSHKKIPAFPFGRQRESGVTDDRGQGAHLTYTEDLAGCCNAQD